MAAASHYDSSYCNEQYCDCIKTTLPQEIKPMSEEIGGDCLNRPERIID